MSEHDGPMGLACQEIRNAIDEFAAERHEGRRLPALLQRTDALLAELETLNLMAVRRTPPSLRSDLTRLATVLPFAYMPPIGPRPSPTAAMDVVFEIQAGLFRLMYGTEADAEAPEEAS
ncbi:MAG: hypothetical protein QOH92_3646 [Chloroflexota bacterium]|jgi:hypothetical protein|nr:hypothetical protein [Chloroflexota bacterium]